MINDPSSMKIDTSKGYGSSKVGGTKDPKKDFRKILSKERREDQGEGEKQEIVKENKEVEEAAPVIADADLPISEFPKEMQEESLSALFKGYGSKDKLKALQQEVQVVSQKSAQILPAEIGRNGVPPMPMEDLAAE